MLKDKGLAKRMLVVAPLRPCYSVWPHEANKWEHLSDLTYAVVHGANKEYQLSLDVDVHIINPEGLKWLLDPNYPGRLGDWDILCVDESTNFKDSQTARFKQLKPHIWRFTRRWILTGTPTPNGLMDLFGQVYILDQGNALGRFITHYRRDYFFTEAWNPYNYIPKEGSWDKIMDRINPLMLRLSAEEHLAMPRLMPPNDIMVDLPPDARQIYEEIASEFIAQVAGRTIIAANIAVAGGKCRQICNGALYTTDGVGEKDRVFEVIHEEKISAVKELVSSLQGAPAIIVYEFNHDRRRLLECFGLDTPCLGGSTTPRQADDIIRRFNRGEIPVLLTYPIDGVNLQEACHHIIWFSLTWDLRLYQQTIDRIYRQGQKETVFVHRIMVRDSIEQRVVEVLDGKADLQEALLGELQWHK